MLSKLCLAVTVWLRYGRLIWPASRGLIKKCVAAAVAHEVDDFFQDDGNPYGVLSICSKYKN